MESMADKENPQGIIAVVRQKANLDSQLCHLLITRAVALVSPQDPRQCGDHPAHAGRGGCRRVVPARRGVELYHPTVIRSSMGTIFWKPVIQASFEQFLAWARRGNFNDRHICSWNVEYQTFIPDPPWVLVLGNEQKGLSAEQTRACDVTLSLPMKGRVSSLNLAVAQQVCCLYQLADMSRRLTWRFKWKSALFS
jgi:RNA methyltransferase, TrmH family